jgi:hypothetical protein
MKKPLIALSIMVALSIAVLLCIANYGPRSIQKSTALKKAAPSWEQVVNGGKGVHLIKVNARKGSEYFIVQGTNLQLPLSTILQLGLRFESLNSLAEFLRDKPPSCEVFDATGAIQDDLGRVETFSPAEKKMIWDLLTD